MKKSLYYKLFYYIKGSATDPRKGLTLLEIMVAMSIFLLAVGMIFLFITQSYKVQNYSFEQSSAIKEAQQGVETMVKEIREALPGDDGAYPIEKAGDFELIFYADIDKDIAIERVRYFLDGSNFKKGVIEPTEHPIKYQTEDEVTNYLSQYVRNGGIPVFTYYKGDYPAIPTPLPIPADVTEVKLIHVYLKINVIPSRPPSDFELESDVQIRNLKENL